MSACALCNRIHDGDCVEKIKNCCLICGDCHNAFVACPCPRCLHRHGNYECTSVEEWRGSSYKQFDAFVGACCLICGNYHDQLPCPRWSSDSCVMCGHDHEGRCGGLIDQSCLICGEVHDVSIACTCPRCHQCESLCECGLSVARIHLHGIDHHCWLCGECHLSLQSCPCPRCYHSHPFGDCPRVSASLPCRRCNIWHGDDVCARSDDRAKGHIRDPVQIFTGIV